MRYSKHNIAKCLALHSHMKSNVRFLNRLVIELPRMP